MRLEKLQSFPRRSSLSLGNEHVAMVDLSLNIICFLVSVSVLISLASCLMAMIIGEDTALCQRKSSSTENSKKYQHVAMMDLSLDTKFECQHLSFVSLPNLAEYLTQWELETIQPFSKVQWHPTTILEISVGICPAHISLIFGSTLILSWELDAIQYFPRRAPEARDTRETPWTISVLIEVEWCQQLERQQLLVKTANPRKGPHEQSASERRRELPRDWNDRQILVQMKANLPRKGPKEVGRLQSKEITERWNYACRYKLQMRRETPPHKQVDQYAARKGTYPRARDSGRGSKTKSELRWMIQPRESNEASSKTSEIFLHTI